MSEPENFVPHLLRELRADMDARFDAANARFDATSAELRDVKKRMDSMSQAISGESVLGRYAAAAVEKELGALRRRLDVVERRR